MCCQAPFSVCLFEWPHDERVIWIKGQPKQLGRSFGFATQVTGVLRQGEESPSLIQRRLSVPSLHLKLIKVAAHFKRMLLNEAARVGRGKKKTLSLKH